MIMDKENIYSEDQALTTTAVSTNIIDHGALAGQFGAGEEIEILVQVTADLATGTSVQVSFGTDDNASFSSEAILLTTAAIATASLVAGYRFATIKVPVALLERYTRITYTIVGTYDAGTVTAALVVDSQTNL